MGIVRPHLWFDDQAEDGRRFYASVIPNTDDPLRRDGAAGHAGRRRGRRVHRRAHASTACGSTFLNAGPVFTLDEAFSFVLDCQDQAEVDHYWDDPDRRRRPTEPVRLARRQVRRVLAGGPRAAGPTMMSRRRRRGRRARHGGDADDGQARHRRARGRVPRRVRDAVGGIGLDGPVLTIASVNVNGIRAAYKRGMGDLAGGPQAGRDPPAGGPRDRRDPGGPPAARGVAPRARGQRDRRAGRASRSRQQAADDGRADRAEDRRDRRLRPLGRGRPGAPRARGRTGAEHHGRVDVPALRDASGTPSMDEKYAFLDHVTGAAGGHRRAGRLRGRRRGREHRAPRGGHQELEGQPQVGGLPAARARLPRPLVRRPRLARPRPRARRRGTGAVHVVVVARAGVRQRRRLAHRLPAGHARPRRRRGRARPSTGRPRTPSGSPTTRPWSSSTTSERAPTLARIV